MGLLDAPPHPAARRRIDIDRPGVMGTASVAPVGQDPVLNAYQTGIAGVFGGESLQDSFMRLAAIRRQSGGLSPEYAAAIFDSPLAPGFSVMATTQDVASGLAKVLDDVPARPAFDPITDDLVTNYRKYYRNRTFDDVDAAREQIRRRIESENAKHASFFPPTDPGVADRLEFVRSGNKFKISQKGLLAPRAPLEFFDAPPDGARAPAVNWRARDMQDYGGTREVFVSLDALPQPKLAGGRNQYDWSEMPLDRGGFPPATIKINKNGTVSIVDGNHRLSYWRDQGMDVVPVRIIEAEK